MASKLHMQPSFKSTRSAKSHTSTGPTDLEDAHATVPLPIQSFLWRQTNPFLGPKVGKLHEASCVTFQRVIVQSNTDGLSPSLSDAIDSIPRWRFIRAALPHLIQCCSALLAEHHVRNELHAADADWDTKPCQSLVKLLYILHWMITSSADECHGEQNSLQQFSSEEAVMSQFTFPVSGIQAFVYLLVPLINSLAPADFEDEPRLESAIHIWESLWQHEQPNVFAFQAAVKPRKMTTQNAKGSGLSTPKVTVHSGEPSKVIDASPPIGSKATAVRKHTMDSIVEKPINGDASTTANLLYRIT